MIVFCIRLKLCKLIVISTVLIIPLLLSSLALANSSLEFDQTNSITFAVILNNNSDITDKDIKMIDVNDYYFPNERTFSPVWLKKDSFFLILSKQIRSLKIEQLKNKNTLVSVILNPDDKKLIDSFFYYTKRNLGKRVAVFIENKILITITILDPIKNEFKLFFSDLDTKKIQSIFTKIKKDIHIVPTTATHMLISESENDGDNFFSKGDYNKAISKYSKAIEENALPSPNVLYKRGVCFGELGQHDRAIEDFNKAIKLIPNFDLAYSLRGVSWIMKGFYKKAIHDYNIALNLNPNNYVYYSNLSWLLATCEDSDVRDGIRAINLAKEAIKLNSAMINYDILAAAYAEVGNFEDAVRIQKTNLEVLTKKSVDKQINMATKRLTFYQNKKSWREKFPVPIYY